MVSTALSANEAASGLSANEAASGFSARVGAGEARRQLRMSVGVVLMLAISIVSAAVTVGSHPLSAKRDVASTLGATMIHAETNAVGATPI